MKAINVYFSFHVFVLVLLKHNVSKFNIKLTKVFMYYFYIDIYTY